MKAFYRRTTLFLVVLIACSAWKLQAQDPNPQLYGFDEGYEATIDSIITTMSLEEKVYMVHGDGMFTSGGIARLNIPDITYTDGPTGIREELEHRSWQTMSWTTDSVTFFPTGTALAATWNKELAYRYGLAIGDEARARGKDILLGPGVNIIRTPLCGRNFEYFSEDPLLASVMTVGYVKGVQMQDVAACVKHFTINNQEYMRSLIDVHADERTLREIYLPTYKAAALDAQTYSFMGSYNKFRGDWVCENDYLLNQVMKGEWNYQGVVVSDWGATHSTVKAALAGLDVEMGNGWGRKEHYFASLADSVKAGKVPESVLDDKVRRLLRLAYNCRTTDPDRNKGSMNSPENSQLAYDVASEAIVLLKNENNTLPLDKTHTGKIAVIGMMADMINAKGGYTAGVKARYEITPLQGIRDYLGEDVLLDFAPGYKEDFIVVDTGGHWPHRYPNPAPNDTLLKDAVNLAGQSDLVLLFVGNPRSVETEATDRETLALPFGQDSLIQAVTAANPNTVIIVVAGAATDLNRASKSTPALAYSWYNGSENGKALADMLFGDINPSGKLPFTIPKKLEDIGAHAFDKHTYPGVNGSVEYKEGILVGYRWFDTKAIEPAYCFGYGLSYTTFKIPSVKINQNTFLAEDVISLAVQVENTGAIPGKETVQVYVGKSDSKVQRAEKELKGFAKVSVEPGKTSTAEIDIPVSDLAYYDTDQKLWIVEPGEYRLIVGNSSRSVSREFKIQVQ
ncbi:MAG: glycoside hydrolase family 3 C-terminal domain-containing protein [Bacteroidales bacterium]|nr:glycoside hydrolase family 3 C-terminal domain-containing protein [Bacteroidales bacterium]